MKKWTRLSLAFAAVALLGACSTGPKITDMEEPDVAWQVEQRFDHLIAAGDESLIILPAATLRGFDGPGRVINVQDGKTTEELSDAETAQLTADVLQEQYGFSMSLTIVNKFSPRTWDFPDRGLHVEVGEQRFGLVRNNVKEPQDDILVFDGAGNLLKTLTRRGILWDVTLTDDGLLLLTSGAQNDEAADARQFAIRKYDFETGAEVWTATTQVMPAYNHYGFNVAPLIVVDGHVLVSSQGVSSVDLTTGDEIWYVENSPVTGTGRAMMGLGFSGRLNPAPIVHGNTVVIHDIDGVFRGIDLADGRVAWESEDIGWHDDIVVSSDGEHMFVALGLAGMKPATSKRGAKYQFQGRPGLASINPATGEQEWNIRLDEPVMGMAESGNSLTVFAETEVLAVAVADGSTSILVDMKSDWDVRSEVLACDLTRFHGEALLTFEDRMIWAATGNAERSGEVSFGMSAVTPLTGLIGLSYRTVNNSLLVEIAKDNELYLYVIDAPSRNLRYYQMLVSTTGFYRYDHLSMYVLSTNKRGYHGGTPGTVLTSYRIP